MYGLIQQGQPITAITLGCREKGRPGGEFRVYGDSARCGAKVRPISSHEAVLWIATSVRADHVRNQLKDWEQKYERLTNMVVPRSSQSVPSSHGGGSIRRIANQLTHRRLAQDDEYFLQTVTVFKKVRDEYVHKCRENK